MKSKISTIIPMRNSETTIIKTLRSLEKQTIKVFEIIIIDNVSTDSSIDLVQNYSKGSNNIKLILNKKNIGVGGSYNKAVNLAKGDLLVFMHSDSVLPTKYELSKLIKPHSNKDVVATYSHIVLPEYVWNKYNFWQKLLLARAVGKEQAGLNDKFDCINKKVFKKVGGFNTKHYGHNIGIGAEDADLHMRLKRIGKVLSTPARIIHLHYLGGDYSIKDFFINRKLLARSYGRLIRLEGFNLDAGAIFFAIKPILVLIAILPFLFPYNILLLIIFSLFYYQKMYISKSANEDSRIFLLPFVTILLIFLETFWMAESLLFLNKKKV